MIAHMWQILKKIQQKYLQGSFPVQFECGLTGMVLIKGSGI
jgi:hypothetical protein